MKVNDKTDAVAVITTTGVIRVVNRTLVKMFGYRRQEDLVRGEKAPFCSAPAA